MSLSGAQLEELQEVLEGAFPSRQRLAQLVRFKLDENLEKIAGGANLGEAVFNLIQWAEAAGRTQDLITGAHQRNPGNSESRSSGNQ